MRKTLTVLAGAAAAAAMITGAGAGVGKCPAGWPGGLADRDLLPDDHPAERRPGTRSSRPACSPPAPPTYRAASLTSSAFPGGTFEIHHGGALHVIKEQPDPEACLAVFEATASLMAGSGSGTYKHIGGSGKAVISSMFIARRSRGACNPHLNPVVNEQAITATAHIHLQPARRRHTGWAAGPARVRKRPIGGGGL